jgi:N-carbamoyl-L-amino-acid hydrolase
MDKELSALRINPDRMKGDFEQLGEFGATEDGGVHRPALSEAHLSARSWFRDRILAAGLMFAIDGAGNHSGILQCASSNAPTLLIGSHLDSVPFGGQFDGALGVLAALEVLRTIKESGITLPVNLEVIDFTDEEGTLVGLLGSAALAGKLTLGHLQGPRGGREQLQNLLSRASLTEGGFQEAARNPNALAGYLELHIEQGPRLFESKVDIGIVTTIVGIASYRLTFIGTANHAGTTPMKNRRDAGQGASDFTLAARNCVLDHYPKSVVNVGKMDFYPGAFNIIPSRVDLALEFRCPNTDLMDRLEDALNGKARLAADNYGLEFEFETLDKHPPAKMSKDVLDIIASASSALGLEHTSLTSGAGHDAQSLADICPTGMIFVPSKDGISHSPVEFTDWRDCINGANVLLQTAIRFASERPSI